MAKQSQAWKNLERKTAKQLGGKRITRGEDFSISALDVEHRRLAIDCKYRQKWGFVAQYDKLVADTRRLYKGQNKIPVLVVKKARRRGEFVIIAMTDFLQVIKDEFKEELDDFDFRDTTSKLDNQSD